MSQPQSDFSFITPNYKLARALIANGVALTKTFKNGKIYFIFEDKDRAQAIANGYLRGDLVCNVKLLDQAETQVKDIIHGNYISFERLQGL